MNTNIFKKKKNFKSIKKIKLLNKIYKNDNKLYINIKNGFLLLSIFTFYQLLLFTLLLSLKNTI